MHWLICCMALSSCVVGELSGCFLDPFGTLPAAFCCGLDGFTDLHYFAICPVLWHMKHFFSCRSCAFLSAFESVFHSLLVEVFCGLPYDCPAVSFHVLLSQSQHFFHWFWYSLFQKQGHLHCTCIEKLFVYEQVDNPSMLFSHFAISVHFVKNLLSHATNWKPVSPTSGWFSLNFWRNPSSVLTLSSYSCSRAVFKFHSCLHRLVEN